MSIEDMFAYELDSGRHHKVNERNQLLRERPELRLTLRAEPLKRIIDYTAFKCASNCSIATNTAILGSDIDGGQVITESRVSPQLRLNFVSELRNQGFSAFDISEYEEAKKQLEDFGRTRKHKSYKDGQDLDILHELVGKVVDAETGLIRFFSTDEIKHFKKKGFPDEGTENVNYRGYSIE